MVRTKWMFIVGIALLGCVNAFMEGEKVHNVRRVRRRRLVSPSRVEDGSVIAAIAASKSNNTMYQVPSTPATSQETLAKAHLPERKSRLFR